MATRKGRRTKDPCVTDMGANLAPYLSILCNNVQIYGEDTQNVPPTYIIRTLVERGGIAFLRREKQWAAFSSIGALRRTKFPRQVRLYGDMGKLSEPLDVAADNSGDICIIPANAYFAPPVNEIAEKVKALDQIAVALGQNLNAIKQASAIIYDDKDLKGQLEVAEERRKSGEATVLIQKKVGSDVHIENFSPNAQCYITELLAVWTQTMEELDERAGKVKVGEKTERRTDDEISVIENSACSTIDTIIDTFNNYCKWYGIKARAERGVEIKQTKQEEEGDEENVDGSTIDNTEVGE